MNKTISAAVVLGSVMFGSAGALAQHDEHACEDCEDYAVEVRCSAVNEFGNVASARGTLRVTGRSEQDRLAVSGTLRINAKLYGDPDNRRRVHVEASVDLLGHYLSGSVISDDELGTLFLAFVNGSSYIEGQNGTQYQTECLSSRVNFPLIGDLVPTGTLRFSELPDGQQRAQIDVSNVGNDAVSAPQIRVRVGDQQATGALMHPFGGNALVGGDQGYIEVDLPAGTLSRCADYDVELDLDHEAQFGPFDPFSNDAALVISPCLRWDSPITEDSLGSTPDPLIQGLTLGSILSSDVVARADGQRCSACHFPGSGKPYSPPAGQIAPNQDIGGLTWAQPGGWVDAFTAQTIKPEYLKQLMLRWRADGAL